MRPLLALVILIVAGLNLSRSAETRPAAPERAEASSAEGAFAVDSRHSGVLFRIRHMGLAHFWGRFNHIEGVFNLAEDPAACSVEVTIDAASVDTNSEGRDKHVKGPDFFNVKEYPEIRFVSTEVEIDGDDYTIEGNMTLLGETQEVTIQMTKIGQAETRQGVKCGFEGEFVFDRKAFGMTALEGALGTDVRCILFIEAGQQD